MAVSWCTTTSGVAPRPSPRSAPRRRTRPPRPRRHRPRAARPRSPRSASCRSPRDPPRAAGARATARSPRSHRRRRPSWAERYRHAKEPADHPPRAPRCSGWVGLAARDRCRGRGLVGPGLLAAGTTSRATPQRCSRRGRRSSGPRHRRRPRRPRRSRSSPCSGASRRMRPRRSRSGRRRSAPPAGTALATELVLDESSSIARTSTTVAVAISVSRAASQAALCAWTWDLIELVGCENWDMTDLLGWVGTERGRACARPLSRRLQAGNSRVTFDARWISGSSARWRFPTAIGRSRLAGRGSARCWECCCCTRTRWSPATA